MGKLGRFFLDLLFPPNCLICQKTGRFICSSCQKKMSYLNRQVCPYCAKPSLTGQVHQSCQKGYFLDGLVSAFPYHPLFKEVIAQIKFEPYIFSALKELTLNALLYFDEDDRFLPFRELVDKESPVVIPIPLHKNKLRQRGFNQAQIIGRSVADHYHLPLETKLLLRSRPTKPQSSLEEKDRKKNIKGAFLVDKLRLNNCSGPFPSVLLVDDIWTTGATAKEAGRILKRVGFSKVWALTLAQ